MEQFHIYYSGHVQGVGFRYMVQKFAKELDLNGWVKNLPDGRVEALIEGEKVKFLELQHKINSYFDGKIKDIAVKSLESSTQFSHFEIKH